MFFGNIDKGLATTIVLLVAAIIEVILFVALLFNIAKKAKQNRNNYQAANMFDNSPSDFSNSSFEETSTPETFDNNLNDLAVPGVMINQETSFDSDNLMEMQKNDTLNIQDNNYQEDASNQEYNSFENNASFGSLENLPDIIIDNNDTLPTSNELDNNPNEIVESEIPDMTYDMPTINQPDMGNAFSQDINMVNESPVPDMTYDTPIDNQNMDLPNNSVPDLNLDYPDSDDDNNNFY